MARASRKDDERLLERLRLRRHGLTLDAIAGRQNVSTTAIWLSIRKVCAADVMESGEDRAGVIEAYRPKQPPPGDKQRQQEAAE